MLSMETKALLKAIYRALLTSEDIIDGQNVVATMMDPEDVAYVKQMLEDLESLRNNKEE